MSARTLLQYACPSCAEPGHIDLSNHPTRNARCKLCGWVGDSSEAANAADDLNKQAQRWTCKALDGDEGETCGVLHKSPQTAARHRARIERQIPGEWEITKAPVGGEK